MSTRGCSSAASYVYKGQHRFDSNLSGSVALAGTQSRIEDAFGVANYTLLSMPGELVYDSRNNKPDPSHGVNALFQLCL